MSPQFEQIISRVSRQQYHGSDFIFGPTLSETQLAAFEAKYGIALPQDYRDFLLHIGNGGPGPACGMLELGTLNDEPWEDWYIGDLAKPFPHADEWNPYPFGPDDDPSDEELEKIEPEYFATKHINGTIPITDHGCGIYYLLVVTGPEAGRVWVDHRTDWEGIFPASGRPDFAQWYFGWLT